MVVAALLFAAGELSATDVPGLRAHVNDYAAVLGDKAPAIDDTLAEYERSTGHQVVVLTVNSLEGQDIETYASDVFAQWKLGRKRADDGVLIVVAVADHRVRIEVGYGLEGDLTDLTSSRIIRERMLPSFKKDDFAAGISNGVQAVLTVLSGQPMGTTVSVREVVRPELPPFGYLLALVAFAIFSLLAGSGGGWPSLCIPGTAGILLFALFAWPISMGLLVVAMAVIYAMRLQGLRGRADNNNAKRRHWQDAPRKKSAAATQRRRRRSKPTSRAASAVTPSSFSLKQVLLWRGSWASGSRGDLADGYADRHDRFTSHDDVSSGTSSSDNSSYSGGGGGSGGGGASGSW